MKAPIIALCMVLYARSSLAATLRGGTTQVLLASQDAVTIASDSRQHESNSGTFSDEKQKVCHVGRELILAISGICATTDGQGRVTFDLQDSAPDEARRLVWSDPASDIERLANWTRTELRTLEQMTFQGKPDPLIAPHITLLIGGLDRSRKIFAARILFKGEYVTNGDVHVIKFAKHVTDMKPIDPGKIIALVETRLESLQKAAMDICAGRDQRIFKYPKVLRLHTPGALLDEDALKGAASDLVQFTVDNDERIGGPIDVLAVARHR